MLATVRNRWKLFPITLIFFVISLGLFIGERTYELHFPEDASEVRRALGAATTLTRVERVDGQLMPIPEFHGPFDIWNGEVWRVFVNTFVHEDLLHLGSNLVGLIFLGYWLETRIRRIDYFMFFMVAGVGSMLIEFLLGNVPVGISGAIYAIFGRLLVMRYYDEQLREEFSEPLVGLGIIWLLLCVPLTTNGLMPIANGAHFFGFFYGLFVGLLQIRTKWQWSRRFAVTTFLAAHVLFVPGFYFVAHPVWDGRFQWFRSEQEQTVGQRENRLKMAVKLNPELARAWHDLATLQQETNQYRSALWTLANGVYHNRSDEMLNQAFEDIVVRIHRSGSRTDQATLTQTIDDVFGDESNDWTDRLNQIVASAIKFRISSDVYKQELEASVIGVDGLDRTDWKKSPPAAPRVDPTDPESAAMGVTL